MKNKYLSFILFSVVLLEGYVILSSEMLAIRQTIPFVGSGTDTLSIIIAAVLMPLAFGYQKGGRFKPGFQKNGAYVTVRRKLVFNMLVAMAILLFGLSYLFLSLFFTVAFEWGLKNRLLLVSLYSTLFLVVPVYLLGQTIPLISHYFSKQALAEVTGRMLFFSTVGSFLGAVFASLVLMAHFGVHHTVTVNFILLAFLIMLLAKKKFSPAPIMGFVLAVLAATANSEKVMQDMNIVGNNQYNTAVFLKRGEERHLVLNNNASSVFTKSGKKHDYIEYMEKLALDPIMNKAEPTKDILVVGAGAFTLGYEDMRNIYDFIDIDKTLKDLAEDYILPAPLGENKHFHPLPARAYLSGSQKRYDVIILDAYLGGLSLPEHLVTVEFFNQVKAHLKPNGRVVANFVVSPTFEGRFSRRLDNTFRAAFQNVNRHVLGNYDLWADDNAPYTNVIYSYKAPEEEIGKSQELYSDNFNQVFLDKPFYMKARKK